jgi:hypothetical protein
MANGNYDSVNLSLSLIIDIWYLVIRNTDYSILDLNVTEVCDF